MSVKVSYLVWYSTIKGSSNRLVMLALADRANDQGLCRPGLANLALKTGLKTRAIQYALERLEDDEWLQRLARFKPATGEQTTNGYRINLAKLRTNQHPQDDYDAEDELATAFTALDKTPAQPGVHEMHGGGAFRAPLGVHEMHGGGASNAPSTSFVRHTSIPPSIPPSSQAPTETEGSKDVSPREKRKTAPSTTEAREVLERVKWRRCKLPTKREAPKLEAAINAAVTDGWSYEQLEAHINAALGEVKDPKKAGAYILGALTEHLPMCPPPSKTHTKQPQFVTGATETPLAPEERKTHLEAVRAQIRRPRVSTEDQTALAGK